MKKVLIIVVDFKNFIDKKQKYRIPVADTFTKTVSKIIKNTA